MSKSKLALAMLCIPFYLSGCVTREVHHETEVIEVPTDSPAVVVPGEVLYDENDEPVVVVPAY